MGERELRLRRQVYRLRTFGLALGFVCIGSVFREIGTSRLAWAPICQSLVEAQGGRVGAGPHPEGGALFYVDAPAASAERAS